MAAILRSLERNRISPPDSESAYLARRYRLYGGAAAGADLRVGVDELVVGQLVDRARLQRPSQFGKVLAVNFIVNVCLSSSTV